MILTFSFSLFLHILTTKVAKMTTRDKYALRKFNEPNIFDCEVLYFYQFCPFAFKLIRIVEKVITI